MKTFSGLLFISSVLLALSSVCEGGRPIRRNRSSCPVPKINHGTVRLQKRGRMVYFFCDSGFEIHGSMGVLCTSGRWKQEMPICTKAGCESPPKRQNGWVMLDAKKQTSMLFCRDGYVAAHATIAYCDGKDWDRELGFCRLDVGHTKSCDFETVSLCGWKEDTENDFHWMQRNGWNSYEKLESGPKHDHTKGKPLEGHYLIAEATNSHPSQRSRLFSPVYNQSDSENACFRFFYYMYGQNVGRLRIIIKSVVDKMDKVVDNQKYIFFEKEGSQGNQWIVGDIPVEPTNADFQIMIEVTGSKGVISDIAIDDVALMKDSDCLNNIQSEATTETDEIFDIQSCENRCMETGSVRENTNGTFYRNGHLIEKCDCHQECIILNTCCFDFITKCVEDLTIATMDEINTTEVSITEATTPRSISTSRDVEATLPDIHTRLVKDTSSTPNTKTTNPENASLRTSNITSTKMVTTVTTQKIIVTTTFSPNRGSIVTQSTSIPLISNPKNTHISKSINFQKHKQLPKTKIDQTILYTPSSSILVITSTSTDATLRAMLIPAKKQNSLRDLTWIFAFLSLSILLILTTITWKYLSANRWNNYSSHHVQYKSNYHSEDNEETLVRSGDTSNEILIENKSDSKAKKYSTEKIISLPNLTKMVSDCLTKRCDQYSEKQRLTVNDEQFDFSLQINV